MRYRLAIAALTFAVSAPAVAQDSAQRYQLERTDDGYVRIDTATGAIDTCRERDGQLICRMAADERRAFEDQLDTLSDRIAELEAGGSDAPIGDLADENEFERAMSMMERFIRRFFALVEDLNQDYGLGEDPSADRL